MKKLDLREVFKHSKIVDFVDLTENFTLCIRPWTVVQLEAVQPLIGKLYAELKKKDANTAALEALMAILEKKDLLADTLNIIYITLERSNEVIKDKVSGEEFAFFDLENMKQFLPLQKIRDIVKVIWKQNIEENPSQLSKPNPEAIKN